LRGNNTMLKFIKHHLSTLGDVDVFAIASLLIFMAVFIAMAYYAYFTIKKDQADELSRLPLEDGIDGQIENLNPNNHEVQ
jgi:cbb3-type cytochrome oxidase subunit 3